MLSMRGEAKKQLDQGLSLCEKKCGKMRSAPENSPTPAKTPTIEHWG